MRNRRDEQGSINFNEAFEVREDLQGIYNANQSDIYLWVTLMEKDAERLSNEPTIYAWYCFKVTHFGQVREGTFTLSLYHDDFPFPTPTDMNRLKGRAREEIVIELADLLLAQERPLPAEPSLQRTDLSKQSNSYQSNSKERRNATGSSRRDKQQVLMRIKAEQLNQEGVRNFDESYFRQNESDSAFSPTASHTKIQFTIALAALRTLPSSMGPLKLEINVIDSAGRAVVGREEVLCALKGDMHNPSVGYERRISE
jgi:hypothetical protein